MQLEQYQEFIEKTWNKATNQEVHVSLLLKDEIGELASAYKKVYGYGRELDRKNVIEELGDLFYGLNTHCRLAGIVSEWDSLLQSFQANHLQQDNVTVITEDDINDIIDTLLLNAIMLRTCSKEESIEILNVFMETYRIIMYDINTSLDEIIDANYEKLIKRYPNLAFNVEHSAQRLDKQSTSNGDWQPE